MPDTVIKNPIVNSPAINNHSGFGRWAFLEIDDPWNVQNATRKEISAC